MFNKDKKTALVTGASSGMGKAIASRLLDDGYQVYVAARQVDRMDDLAKRGARPVRMDMSNEREIAAAVDTILAEAGGVDVLVNNAGFGLYGPIEDVSLAEARYQFEVNLFGLGRSIRCSAAGITPPGTRSRGGRTASGWRWLPMASVS